MITWTPGSSDNLPQRWLEHAHLASWLDSHVRLTSHFICQHTFEDRFHAQSVQWCEDCPDVVISGVCTSFAVPCSTSLPGLVSMHRKVTCDGAQTPNSWGWLVRSMPFGGISSTVIVPSMIALMIPTGALKFATLPEGSTILLNHQMGQHKEVTAMVLDGTIIRLPPPDAVAFSKEQSSVMNPCIYHVYIPYGSKLELPKGKTRFCTASTHVVYYSKFG